MSVVLQEKQQETQRRLEDLSQEVLLLERERNELRGALGIASSDSRVDPTCP